MATAAPAPIKRRPRRILIVEDDPISWRAMADYLDAHGYTTLVAETGPDGEAP